MNKQSAVEDNKVTSEYSTTKKMLFALDKYGKIKIKKRRQKRREISLRNRIASYQHSWYSDCKELKSKNHRLGSVSHHL